MEQYLFKMYQSLTAKNKLDQEIHDLLWSMDGTFIKNKKDLNAFQNHLQKKVKEFHGNHPRCKEIKLNIWGHRYLQGKDLTVSCGCSSGKIYEAKHHFGK